MSTAASLPSRGAWIEIIHSKNQGPELYVAPLTGSVDRNANLPGFSPVPQVAPLTGSVDRNDGEEDGGFLPFMSLPSRGAWIEMVEGEAQYRKQMGRSPHGERG